MRNTSILWLIAFLFAIAGQALAQPGPDEECVVTILNRTAVVQPDGSWQLNNLPIAQPGLEVRARITCVNTQTGQTTRFQTNPIELTANTIQGFDAELLAGTPLPNQIVLTTPTKLLTSVGQTAQFTLTATYPDGSMADVTTAETTLFTCSTSDAITVSPEGLMTAVQSGNCMVIAQHEGRTATCLVRVALDQDTDGDGIPDATELLFNMDPNNPADGMGDFDNDGLSNADEVLIHGTDPNNSDTDGDGVNDDVELNDGTDPKSATSVNFAGKGLIQSIQVTPASVNLATNSILPQDVTRQLAVSATLTDGTIVNITAEGTGTNYAPVNLLVVTLGETDGLLVAGNAGSTMVTVSNAGVSVDVPVTVTSFVPRALSFLRLGGHLNSVATDGSHAFVAAGAAGLHIVDVSDPDSPSLVTTEDTPGNANDVRVSANIAYVADGTNGLVSIDVTDAQNCQILQSLSLDGKVANDVFLCGDRAYAVATDTFYIIDICDPAAMSVIGSVSCTTALYGVACDAARDLAVAVGSTVLHTIDTSVENTPSCIAQTTSLGGNAEDVCLTGNYALVTAGLGRLRSVDLTDPSIPTIVSQSPGQGNYFDCAIDPVGLVFCADNISVNAVHPFSILDPANPVATGLINFGGAPSFRDDNGTGVDVFGGLVFMCGNRGSLADRGSTNFDSALHIGRYLQVVDDAGLPPQVTITVPAPNTEVAEGDTTLVQVTATDDVGVAVVEFYVNGTFASSDTSAPYSALLAAPGLGPYTVTALARDFGDNSTSVQRTLIGVANPAPLITITSPSTGDTFVECEEITVTADASDNGFVSQVGFGFGPDGDPFFFDTTVPFEWTVKIPEGIGALVIEATAFDNLNQQTKTAVTINVIADPLTTVIGNVVDEENTPCEGADVTIYGTTYANATDADGNFSIASLPTIHGAVVVSAEKLIADETHRGKSDPPVNPVRAGTTDVGTITLTPRPPVTDVVAYLDDRTFNTGNELIIAKVKNNANLPYGSITPLRLVDSSLAPGALPEAELIDNFDVLILALGNSSRRQELRNHASRLEDFVRAGGVMIFHDSNPGAQHFGFPSPNGDVVPGLDGATFQGLIGSASIDITSPAGPASPLINGPFGTLTNATLDGGFSSTHGWVLANTLPPEVEVLFHDASFGRGPNFAVVICYGLGDGYVIWTSIPAEHYMFLGGGGFPGNLNNIYLPNELAYALDLRNGVESKTPINEEEPP